MATSNNSYQFLGFVFFILFLGWWISFCKKRQQRARAIRRNMNPGLAALARQSREEAPPVLTYTTSTVPVAHAVDAGMGVTMPHGNQSAIPTAYAVAEL